jgi:hypothetical protein
MMKLPVILPVADTIPAVIILPAFKLPVAVINPPVPMVPMLALPDTDTLVNLPTLVILGCAAVVTVPAVVAAPDNAPTNVVAVIALFAKFELIPEVVHSATLPVVALANTM